MRQLEDNRTITTAVIRELPPLLKGIAPGRAKVTATLNDGSVVDLFTYYTDELVFQPGDFTGKTVAEAHALFQARDIEWLRS